MVIKGNLSVYQTNDTTTIHTTVNDYALIVSEDISLNGELKMSGAAILNNTLNVTGATTMNNTLNVTGAATFSVVDATSFNASSDYRIKENVISISDTSYNIDKLRPVTYTNTKAEKQDFGVIAHEIQQQLPFLVSGEKDGENYQSVNYNGLIGLLLNEVQQLKKRVQELEQSKP